jgi:hypothetical protein
MAARSVASRLEAVARGRRDRLLAGALRAECDAATRQRTPAALLLQAVWRGHRVRRAVAAARRRARVDALDALHAEADTDEALAEFLRGGVGGADDGSDGHLSAWLRGVSTFLEREGAEDAARVAAATAAMAAAEAAAAAARAAPRATGPVAVAALITASETSPRNADLPPVARCDTVPPQIADAAAVAAPLAQAGGRCVPQPSGTKLPHAAMAATPCVTPAPTPHKIRHPQEQQRTASTTTTMPPADQSGWNVSAATKRLMQVRAARMTAGGDHRGFRR